MNVRFAEGGMHAPLITLPRPEQVSSVALDRQHLDAQRIVGFRNADIQARPFKLLRSQILKRRKAESLKLIGITSPAPRAGKSFVASNLAAALSRVVDVYLVDLDLHRPAVATRFGIEQEYGVHHFLTGEVPDLDAVLRRVNEERLVVVPGIKHNAPTAEFLSSARGDSLFAALRALPDETIVLIDMPPVFADDDAIVIGQRIDGYLLVVEDGQTTRKQVTETTRVLAPTPQLGAILNRYSQQIFADDYGYGMSYAYGGYY